MCWEKHASSCSAIVRLHNNTLARHLREFLSHVLTVRAARGDHRLDRRDLQTYAVEGVTKQRLRYPRFSQTVSAVHLRRVRGLAARAEFLGRRLARLPIMRRPALFLYVLT